MAVNSSFQSSSEFKIQAIFAEASRACLSILF